MTDRKQDGDNLREQVQDDFHEHQQRASATGGRQMGRSVTPSDIQRGGGSSGGGGYANSMDRQAGELGRRPSRGTGQVGTGDRGRDYDEQQGGGRADEIVDQQQGGENETDRRGHQYRGRDTDKA